MTNFLLYMASIIKMCVSGVIAFLFISFSIFIFLITLLIMCSINIYFSIRDLVKQCYFDGKLLLMIIREYLKKFNDL